MIDNNPFDALPMRNWRRWLLAVAVLLLASCGGGGGGQSGPPAVTLTFLANPASIGTGAASILSWTTTNATACAASGGWSGDKLTTGTQATGPLTATTTYTLTCSGEGDSISRSTTVIVTSTPPTPTVTLNASPTTVNSGASSTLTWSSTSATSCTASSGWSGPKATSGNQSSGALTVTTTFRLDCTGAGGTANTSRTVFVTPSASLFPLRTEAGKRYLIDAQNTPFFMNGDTPWSLIVQLNLVQVEQYLEDRRQRGMNTVLVNLIEHEFADNAPNNRAGQPPFLTPGDFATPNNAYFDYAVSVIDIAAAKGILVLLTPSYMGYPGASPVEGWYQEMTTNGTTKLRNYGRYLGLRFAGKDNILWVHGGDRDPPTSPGLQLANAIRLGIIESDPTGRWLHTWHAVRGVSAGESVAGNEPWLSVNNIYTSNDNVVEEAFAEYAASSLPIFLSEARYESGGGDGLYIRQQAYHALLSGAIAGHIMGNDPMWYFGSGWQNFLGSGGAQSMPHIKSLFTTRQWWLLEPDTGSSFLTGGISSGTARAVASLASNDSFGLVYLPAVREVTVNLAQLAGPRVTARWFNPGTGAYTSIAGSPFNATGSQAFTPTGANNQRDWVLALESSP